jgi:hypothetical protein
MLGASGFLDADLTIRVAIAAAIAEQATYVLWSVDLNSPSWFGLPAFS